jgi:hypothetical protein
MLYDFSQVPIPTDSVDEELVALPRPWNIKEIKRFILCIGPISSIFDYTTFFVMLYLFKCWDPSRAPLFQTGWFVESLMTQTLIIHIIRTNKIPFLQSRPSWPLLITTYPSWPLEHGFRIPRCPRRLAWSICRAVLAHPAGHAVCLLLPDARGEGLAAANEMDLSPHAYRRLKRIWRRGTVIGLRRCLGFESGPRPTVLIE